MKLVGQSMSSSRKCGAILLFDDNPQTRTARVESLLRLGFHVHAAATFDQASSCWQEEPFALVLLAVSKELRRAVELCERMKQERPLQMVGLLVPHAAQLPPTRCPDLLWPEEGLDYFLARVETLAHHASAA